MSSSNLARLWPLWLVFAVAVSWQAFLWQIGYLAKSGPNFYWALLALILSVPLLLLLWHDVRKLGISQYEGWLLTGFPLAAALVSEPNATITVCCIGIACFAGGRRVLGYLQLHPEGAVEEIAISASLGLGILHVLLFAIGRAALYYLPVFAVLILFPIAFCLREVRLLPGLLRRTGTAWPLLPGMRGWMGSVFSAFAFVFLAPALMVALAPSVYFDMVRIHLPAVAFNIANHALRVPPYLPYAYFPQSVETVMTMSSAFAGQAGAQLAPLLYVAMALLVLFRIGRLCGFDGFECLAGVLAAVSVPAFHWTADAGKNDLALMLFALLALLTFFKWKETGQFNWICLGVFFVAMAAGVKHIALFALPPLAILYAYAAWRQPHRVRAFALLAGIFLLFGSMWFLRSWLETGNPVYPSGIGAAVSSGTHDQRSWWNVVLSRGLRFPWLVHFHGAPYFESVSEYPMGIALVVFLPMWFLIRKAANGAARVTLMFCAIYLFYWLNAIAVIRYAIAPLAILFLFTAALTVRFARAASTPVRVSVLAAVLYTLVFSTCGVLINEVNGPQLSYFTHRIGKEEYLRQAYLPYRSLEVLRGMAAPEDRVLSVGACPAAYAPNPGAFDCRMIDELPWDVILRQMNSGAYRFVMAPVTIAPKIPAIWTPAYSDAAFTVYRSAQSPAPQH